MVKNPAVNAGDTGSIPGSGRRKWQPPPVLLPGKSHGQRSLVGYSPQGHKELEMTERLHFLYCLSHLFIYIHANVSIYAHIHIYISKEYKLE